MHHKYIITFLEQESSELICKFLCSTTIISSYSNSASPVNFELLVPLARSLSNTPTTALVPRSSHLTHPLGYHALSTRRPGGCQLHRNYPNRQARPLAACNINEENQDEYTNADTPPLQGKANKMWGLHWIRARTRAVPPYAPR